MKKYVMALDQGTTSSRCILFDKSGHMRSVVQREFNQIYPKPGWVEHDLSLIHIYGFLYKAVIDIQADDRYL